jgi:phosphoribosylformylglycinamidine cyclo-ligase
MSKITYRDTGVDIDLESSAIKALIRNLTYRRKGRFTMTGSPGHFAGLIDLAIWLLH